MVEQRDYWITKLRASASFVGPSFVKEPPSRVDFANETGARIDCSAGGSPLPTVSWISGDGKPVSIIPQMLELFNNGSLLFLPFNPSGYRHDIHAATYRCVATNSVGRIVSRDVRVRAVVLQSYELQVHYSKSVIRGNTAVLKCAIRNLVREYITVTSWLQDSSFNIYPSIKGDGKYHMLPSGELLVRRVDEADKYRSYQCRAMNRLTASTILSEGHARFSVIDSRVTSAPRTTEKQTSLQVRKDQSVVLPCFAEGNPPPTFRWFRQERQQLRSVQEDERVFKVGESLVVLHADEADAGRWVCVANNSAGVERMDVSLQVTSPLAVSIQPSGQLIVDVGSRAELHCHVTGGNPGSGNSRTWLKDGHVVGPAGSSDQLVIPRVQREDAGMYQCLVRGEEESAQSTVQLILGAAHPQLLYKFIQQTLQPGPPVSLKCIATGNPTPHISWKLDGFQLPQNERFVIGQYVTMHGDVISHVNISNVQVEDGGIYQCTASNRVGEASHSADMRVYGLPFIRPMPNVSAVAGEPLYIACPVAGYPIDSITWEKDGRKLPLNRRQRVFSNGTLLLENVQRDTDRGNYRCTAENKQGRSASQNLALNVIVPPRITPFSFLTDLHVGDRAGVQCFITKGDLPLAIEWRKDGGTLETDITIRQLGEFTSSLSIESLAPHHAGSYTCLATNQAAKATHSSTLLVNVPPRIGPFAFGELIEGVRTQVQCVIQAGDAPLSLKWLKDDVPIPVELAIQITQDTYSSTLAISKVGREHTGKYSCVAANAAKSTRVTAGLVVSVPPRWISEPRDMNVTRDSVVVFDCQADGFPTPTLTWRKIIGNQPNEYQDLSSRSRGLQIFSNGTLLIRQALPEHQGQYLCEATNGIGAGLSATVTLVVHIPPEFEVKSAQASVRRGTSQTLECQVQGDQPMSITWQRDGSQPPVNFNPRYVVKESAVKGGLLSELIISSTVKSDSGTFVCIATNPFGRAERIVHLQVKDAPGKPHDLRILDTGSRSVKLTWSAPTDDSIPVLQYVVQYRQDSGVSDEWQSIAVSSEQTCVIRDLIPASVYSLRVIAENELGAGEPSESIIVRTEGEAPTGEPQNLVVTATASDELRATWSAPLLHLWNGEILGYYVGYREHGLGRLGGFNFSTVQPRAGGSGVALLSGLKKYRKYGVVVQAFNEKGPGPTATEVIAQTLEDVPSAPPLEIKCAAQSSQSLLVKWQPPPQLFQNGQLQGYKIYYENMEESPPGHIEAETKMTTEVSTELHGLQKYSNYSIQAWAFTQVGDGVKSRPIFCMTDEDVPEPPAGVKVLVSSPTSVVVSWALPTRTNGKLVSYTVYSLVLEAGRERDSSKRRLPPTQTHYQVTDLRKGEAYEFWVTALTRVGEGQSTQVVYVTVSNRVPAAIVSFGQTISARKRNTVQLPCLAVGIPPPKHSWACPDGNPPVGEGLTVQKDGSLEIMDIQRHHQGNYTCYVSNSNGSDQIIHTLRVLVAPSAPILNVAGTGPSWIHLQWTVMDNGGSAVRGFIINYRQEEPAEWEERSASRDANTYRLTGLSCGLDYHIQVMAFNSVGSGEPSAILVAKTDGGKPGRPAHAEFLESNTTSVTLLLKSWNNNGCPITSFSIEYREGNQEEWITVGNDVQNRDSFLVVGLWPGTQYVIKVRASNSAGSTVAEYKVATLSVTGVTIGPDSVKVFADEQVPIYFEAGILVPVTVSLLALISLTAAIAICLRRKNEREAMEQRRPESQAMVSLDNKQNLSQREQYYAAVHKGMQTPVRERIPEYADDISPYATFHVAGAERPTSSPAHIQSFVYHDHRLAAMETMQLKSTNQRDDYTKLRGNSKTPSARQCISTGSDYSGSTTDQWSEHNLAISRTDRIPMQSMVYGSSVGGPESSTSPEASPVSDRRAPRLRGHVRRDDTGSFPYSTHLDPPSGFTDSHEVSEAECDMDSFHRLKSVRNTHGKSNSRHAHRSCREKRSHHFTIAV